MFILKKLGIYCLSLCFFQACDKIHFKRKIQQSSAPQAIENIKIHEGENPGEYSVELKWRGFNKANLRLLKTSLEGETLYEAYLHETQDAFYDHDVESGLSYNYEIISGSEENKIVLWKRSLEIPLDVVSNGESISISRYEANKINRIFLFNRGKLLSTDSDLILNLKKLSSESGEIILRNSSQVASQEQNGKNSPNLQALVENFEGHLLIRSLGQDGGKGRPVSSFMQAKRGGNGGNSGMVNFKISGNALGSVSLERLVGKGGKGSQIVPAPGANPSYREGYDGVSGVLAPFCIRYPNGENDGNGCHLENF